MSGASSEAYPMMEHLNTLEPFAAPTNLLPTMVKGHQTLHCPIHSLTIERNVGLSAPQQHSVISRATFRNLIAFSSSPIARCQSAAPKDLKYPNQPRCSIPDKDDNTHTFAYSACVKPSASISPTSSSNISAPLILSSRLTFGSFFRIT